MPRSPSPHRPPRRAIAPRPAAGAGAQPHAPVTPMAFFGSPSPACAHNLTHSVPSRRCHEAHRNLIAADVDGSRISPPSRPHGGSLQSRRPAQRLRGRPAGAAPRARMFHHPPGRMSRGRLTTHGASRRTDDRVLLYLLRRPARSNREPPDRPGRNGLVSGGSQHGRKRAGQAHRPGACTDLSAAARGRRRERFPDSAEIS